MPLLFIYLLKYWVYAIKTYSNIDYLDYYNIKVGIFMKNICDKFYYLISQQAARLFVFIGLGCYAALALFGFIAGMINAPGEFLYLILSLLLNGAILAGLTIGYLKSNDKFMLISIIVVLAFMLANDGVTNFAGLSNLGNMPGSYILNWVFSLLLGISVIAFIVFVILNYFFKKYQLNFLLELTYFLVLIFAVLCEISGIVLAADGRGWENALLPILTAGSYLFIPGILEELFPGELEGLPPMKKQPESIIDANEDEQPAEEEKGE